MANIIVNERASAASYTSASLTFIGNTAIMSIVYFNIPSEAREGVVRFGFCVMILMFAITYAIRIMRSICYRLIIMNYDNFFIVSEKFILKNRRNNFAKPVEIRCRELGRGLPRRVYIRSLCSNEECFFGAPLNKDQQDYIVRKISERVCGMSGA
jgi:hypothetical protein